VADTKLFAEYLHHCLSFFSLLLLLPSLLLLLRKTWLNTTLNFHATEDKHITKYALSTFISVRYFRGSSHDRDTEIYVTRGC